MLYMALERKDAETENLLCDMLIHSSACADLRAFHCTKWLRV
jgi:hypothetical protein